MSARARDWLLVVGGIAIIVIAIFQLTMGSSYEPNDIRSHAFDRLGPGIAIVSGLVVGVVGIMRLLRDNSHE